MSFDSSSVCRVRIISCSRIFGVWVCFWWSCSSVGILFRRSTLRSSRLFSVGSWLTGRKTSFLVFRRGLGFSDALLVVCIYLDFGESGGGYGYAGFRFYSYFGVVFIVVSRFRSVLRFLGIMLEVAF